MRHEYPKCPFMPNRLIDIEGRYIGPVYVIGVVTHLPAQTYEDIMISISQSIPRLDIPEQQDEVAYCRVKYLWMGKKNDLDKSTQNYIGKVCQPTIANICQRGKSWPKLDTDAVKVRQDLRNTATIPITSEESSRKMHV